MLQALPLPLLGSCLCALFSLLPSSHPCLVSHLCLRSASFSSHCLSVFSLSPWIGLSHICFSLSVTLSVCLSLHHSGISGPTSLSPWASLSLRAASFSLTLCLHLSVHLSLCVCVFPGCLNVCLSISLRQVDTPPMSYLMCSFEIPFEYCRSRLTVTKGTGQKKWRDQGGGRPWWCGYPFLLSYSLALSFSKAERKGDNLK